MQDDGRKPVRHIAHRRTIWRATVVMVTAGCVALGALPAHATGDGHLPTGGIASAVDEPDIWDDDVPVGGLHVTGWAADADSGDDPVEVWVTAGGVTASAWLWSSWTDWEVDLPVAAGQHTVCATAVDAGTGDEVELGCLTATVPHYSPMPSTQSFTIEGVAGHVSGMQVLRVDRPVLQGQVCLDPSSAPVDTTDLGLVIELDGGDGVQRVSDVLHPPSFEIDGRRCLEASWQFDAPLSADYGYRPYARLVIGDLAPSASTGGDEGILYVPLGVTPVSPTAGEALTAPSSVLSVRVAGALPPVDVEFEVASVPSGLVVSSGRADVDGDGMASWTVPTTLDLGHYEWRARASDEFGLSAWSATQTFVRDPVHAPLPTSVAMTDGSGELVDGLESASDPQPVLGGSACVDADTWTGSLANLSLRLGVVGDDGHRVDSGVLVPEVVERDGATCLDVEWHVAAFLHPGVHYTPVAQTAGVDVEPSDWVEGSSFVALETAEDRLAGDLDDGSLSREDYARFLLYRWFEPELVPARYRVPDGTDAPELNAVVVDVLSMLGSLDADVAEELTDYFTTGLGGQERIPLSTEEDEARTAQFWVEAQDLRLDHGGDTEPTPEPTGTPAPESSETPVPAPSAGPGAASRSGSPTTAAGAGGVPTQPNAPDTFQWCSDKGRRTVPKALTRSTTATLTCHLSTPKAVFHYTTSDLEATHGVAPDDDVDMLLLDATQGGGPDGVPDEINAIAAAYYQAAGTYADLGFEPIAVPDIMIADIPAALSVPKVGLIYVGKDRPGDGLGRSVYLMRHELFHQYQYEYANILQIGADMGSLGLSGTTTAWWLEATAEWAAHQAETGAHGGPASSSWFRGAELRYSRLLESHLGHADEALTRFVPGIGGARQPQYGAFLFVEYLEQRFGPGIVAETWKTQADQPTRAVDAIAAVLADNYGTELSKVVSAYHRANYTIDTPESVGDASYGDAHRQRWAARLASTGGHPPSKSLTLEPDRVIRRTGAVEAGGASYVDLDVPSDAPEGVTFTVEVEATSGPQSDLRVQIAYFDGYPDLCHPMDDRGMDNSPGRASQTTTLSPSCPTATLIISNANAQGTHPGTDRGEVGFSYTITTEAPTSGTVVEHRGGGTQHHRVNFGDDLRRPLFAADGTATLSIDIGTSVSDGRVVDSLHVLSWDGTVRATETLVINGSPVDLDVHRDASTSDGRVHLLYGSRWRAQAVTYYVIPEGILHDGVNTIELPVTGYLQIYGAYLSTRDPSSPDPDPDPGTDPGPVASRSEAP